MFLRKLFTVGCFLFLAQANSHATTIAEECQQRAMSAYDRGSSQSEKQNLGAIAASKCFKEMGDSIKENDSGNSGSSGMIVAAILFLGGIGFLTYKLFAKRVTPMTKSEILALREQVEAVYEPAPNDSAVMQKVKEQRLASSANIFNTALSGLTSLDTVEMKGYLSECVQELQDIAQEEEASAASIKAAESAYEQAKAAITLERISNCQKVLDSALAARSSVLKILSDDAHDQNDVEDMEALAVLKKTLVQIEESIKNHQAMIADLQANG